MMNKNILIMGSTGKLGTSLLRYAYDNKIKIYTCTCFKNKKKLISQKKKYKFNFSYTLSDSEQINLFLKEIKTNKYKLIYFLDYGSHSLKYLEILLNNNTDSIFAIANKEMIIAGGNILINKFKKTKNTLIPLDSEHFSIYNSYRDKKHSKISKLYITASGGPFYFKKNINLNSVSLKDVVNHPKWNMGINNSIDSSNFLNKLLEMYEVSTLFNLDINKVDFLISPQAFIHSIIEYEDNTFQINCFENNMLITLSRPLNLLFNCKKIPINKNKINVLKNFYICKFNDKRYKIYKHLNFLKSLDHKLQIKLMILNNKAHNLYLNNEIKYNDIIDFIIKNIKKNYYDDNISSFNKILKYINSLNKYYV
jgi:1-deoxy-D-xylulose-5-phosphate reductoisomerase